MSKGQSSRLGELDELVLLAVWRLGDDAYGVPIRQMVDESTGKETSVGAIYASLGRLEQKGYVSSRMGEATPERGGRAKRYYRIEGAGQTALDEADRARRLLRSGLKPSFNFGGHGGE
jgi:PadR family transcriptional regulator, regulatory protein PadR